MSELHFLRPYWFLALIPLAWLLWLLAKRHLSNKHWETICDSELLPYILVGRTGVRKNTSLILFGITGVLMIVALAGPTWERLPQPVFQKQSALVIALDLSYSMYADDIKPSRLERARFKISDLLDLRKEGQTALLVYAGDAFTVTPLTDDIKTIKSQLTALSPEIMPAPGSNTGIAIEKAVSLLSQAGHSRGDILLITDEVNPEYEQDFISASNKGYLVSILAVGTDEGAPVKLSDGGFLKDLQGTIVIPGLEQNILNKLARAGNGDYVLSQINDSDIERLNRLFSRGLDTDKETEMEFDTDQWHEFGPWLILLIIPLIALSFRRGYLSILLCIMLVNPDDTMAFEWRDLWLNKNQQAMQALENEQADVAAELFQDQDWQAAAKYRAGDFVAAEELLNQYVDERSLYNKGNSLAKQGRYQEALAAYDKVLEDNPNHEDAKFNKEIIEKELQKQQNQQQSQSGQDSEQQQESEQQQGQQQNNSGNQNSEQQSSEQTQGESQQDGAQASEQEESDVGEQQAQQQEKNAEQNENDQAEQNEGKMAEQQQEQANNEQATAEQQSMNDLDEEQLASEQWLRRIPDDPAGLLRRKFKYQYQQQNRRPTTEQYW